MPKNWSPHWVQDSIQNDYQVNKVTRCSHCGIYKVFKRTQYSTSDCVWVGVCVCVQSIPLRFLVAIWPHYIRNTRLQFAYLDHKFIIFLILLKSSLITFNYYFLISLEYAMFPIFSIYCIFLLEAKQFIKENSAIINTGKFRQFQSTSINTDFAST